MIDIHKEIDEFITHIKGQTFSSHSQFIDYLQGKLKFSLSEAEKAGFKRGKEELLKDFRTDKESDANILQWFHDRLINLHRESEHYDYMHRLRKIITTIRNIENTKFELEKLKELTNE